MEPVPVRCRIPELLDRIGKDQQWLANVTGKKKQKISDYCTMREIPNLRTGWILARTLGCHVEDLHVLEWRQQK